MTPAAHRVALVDPSDAGSAKLVDLLGPAVLLANDRALIRQETGPPGTRDACGRVWGSSAAPRSRSGRPRPLRWVPEAVWPAWSASAQAHPVAVTSSRPRWASGGWFGRRCTPVPGAETYRAKSLRAVQLTGVCQSPAFAAGGHSIFPLGRGRVGDAGEACMTVTERSRGPVAHSRAGKRIDCPALHGRGCGAIAPPSRRPCGIQRCRHRLHVHAPDHRACRTGCSHRGGVVRSCATRGRLVHDQRRGRHARVARHSARRHPKEVGY